MTKKFLLEAVVDSIDAAIAAENAGADRLELCSGLDVGGLTPGGGLLKFVCKLVSIPVQVLIRSRGGDFLYSQAEFETLLIETEEARSAGAAGIVAGILLPNGDLDVVRMKMLVEAAAPLPVTFHRAFDRIPDRIRGLSQLLETGCNRLLSSGLTVNALAGAANLRWLNENAKGKIIIMPGGGVSAENVCQIAEETGTKEFHFSAIRQTSSKMTIPNSQNEQEEPKTWIPAAEKVVAIREILNDYFSKNDKQ